MKRRLRQKITEVSAQLVKLGLNQAAAGNVSARLDDDHFLITPSGLPPRDISVRQVVEMGLDGGYDSEWKPSSEWRMHRDIYAARPDVRAVIHTHSPFCTTLACMERAIPAFHYMVAVTGRAEIRCAPYATFGSQELSDYAVAALEGSKACLLAHHGMLVLGDTLDHTLQLAIEVEALAEQYWRCLQIGEPKILPDDEMARVIDKFKGYGVNAQKPKE